MANESHTKLELLMLMLVCSALVMVARANKRGGGRAFEHHSDDSQTSYTLDIDESNQPTLPACVDENAVCGFQQLNPKGFFRIPICSCPGSLECPLDSIEFDGSRTLSHGLDFYKYCRRKPMLSTCRANETAMSTVSEYLTASSEPRVNHHQWHCECPPDHLLKQNDYKFETFETSFIALTKSSCIKRPQCQKRDTCAIYTDTATNVLVKNGCNCPRRTYCQQNLNRAFEVEQYDKGSSYHMRCISRF